MMADNQAIEPVIDTTELFYPSEDAEPLKPTDESREESPGGDELDESLEAEEEDSDNASETEDETDTEESEEDEGDDEGAEEEESLYVELDGEEISLDEIRDMKKSHDAGKSMQADYTRKTQALADDKKAFEANREAFDTMKSKVDGMAAELEAMVAEDDAVDWADLKEFDPEKYIELKEKSDARKKKVAEIKAELPKSDVLSNDQVLAEKQDLFAANPTWLKDGELTDEYNADIKRAVTYAKGLGYSDQELQQLTYSHHWKTLLDASLNAEAKKPGKKKSVLEKKVRKAPMVTKPKKVKVAKSKADLFYSD